MIMEKEMKVLFVSLGCDKNLVDTEMMLGLLQQKGYSFNAESHINFSSPRNNQLLKSIEDLQLV